MKTRPEPPVEDKEGLNDDSWAYLVLEPRETYDEALLGVVPLESVSEVEDERLTHVALYCRTRVLIQLARSMDPPLSWSSVLECHYLNQDSGAHPPLPMYVDPPEGWEELKSGRWGGLWRELCEVMDSLPPEED